MRHKKRLGQEEFVREKDDVLNRVRFEKQNENGRWVVPALFLVR
jgi:hypothetical protein